MRRAILLARLLVTPPRLQPAAPPFTRAGGRKRLRVRAFARSLASLRAFARAARQRAFALYSGNDRHQTTIIAFYFHCHL